MLNQLAKIVVINGHYSQPYTSLTGVPEGDPISVVAALLIG
jgi:hypothetical protein